MDESTDELTHWPSFADQFLLSFLLFLGLSVTFNLPVLLAYNRARSTATGTVQAYTQLKKEYDLLQQKLAALTTDYKKACDDLLQHKARIEDLLITVKGLEQSLLQERNAHNTTKVELAKLALENENLGAEILRLKAEIAKLLAEGKGMLGAQPLANLTIDEFKAKIASLEAALKAETLKRIGAESELAKVKKELDDAIAAIAMLNGNKAQVIALATELAAVKKERDSLKEENKRLKKEQRKYDESGHQMPGAIFLTDAVESTGSGGFHFTSNSAKLNAEFLQHFDKQHVVGQILYGIAVHSPDFIEIMGHTDTDAVHSEPGFKYVDLDWKLGDYLRNPDLIPEEGHRVKGIGSNFDLGILRAIKVQSKIAEELRAIMNGPQAEIRGKLRREIALAGFKDVTDAMVDIVLEKLPQIQYRLYSAGPAVLPLHGDYRHGFDEAGKPKAGWFQAPPIKAREGERTADGALVQDKARRRIEIRVDQRRYVPPTEKAR